MANTADVIVIGGGVAGASTAMQLALRGQKVIVLERGMLGSGSTGRAAGLLGQLRSTPDATRMLLDGLQIIRELERRTGRELFVETGSLRVAQTPERAAEIRAHVALGREVGLPVDHVDDAELARLVPHMRRDDLLDGCYCPTDGHVQPAELLAAYVEVARADGVQFRTSCAVERIDVEAGRARGVRAGGEDFSAATIVNSTGPWSYLLAGLTETRLPTAALGHIYLVTTPQPDVSIARTSPAVRDRENRIYARAESGGLLVGMYEAEPLEFDMESLPADFDMLQMRPRRDDLNVARLIDGASRRFPFITERTPMTITQGIMTFTPDGRPLCGRFEQIEGLYHCSGFSGHGIVQSPSIGRIMAELILDGTCRYDLAQIEADRFAEVPEFADRAAIKGRCYEMYANYYGKVTATDAG